MVFEETRAILLNEAFVSRDEIVVVICWGTAAGDEDIGEVTSLLIQTSPLGGLGLYIERESV